MKNGCRGGEAQRLRATKENQRTKREAGMKIRGDSRGLYSHYKSTQLSLLRRDTNLVQFSDSLVIKEENNNHFLSLE